MKYLLPPVTYYKANLHTHTTCSDGVLTPEQARDAYKEKGYSILATTDHSYIATHQHLNTEDFLMLTGVEVDLEELSETKKWQHLRVSHFCLISKEPENLWVPFKDPNPIPNSKALEPTNIIGDCSREYSPENANAVIAACNEHGYLVTYNHPCWSLETYPDYAPLKGLWGMEYRNSGCIALGYDEDNSRVYQDLLLQGNRLVPVCADDMHRIFEGNSNYPVLGDSWNMIGAKELTYDAVIEAMEKGDLYASCGPEITALTMDGANLHIECSPAARIQVVTPMRLSHLVFAPEGETLTSADFDMSKWLQLNQDQEVAFFRLIVTDERGRYAVTRAYYYDEVKD